MYVTAQEYEALSLAHAVPEEELESALKAAEAQYGELLDNPLASYSVNGVSMSWDKSKILRVSDVDTSSAVYSLLRKTGLTYRGVP